MRLLLMFDLPTISTKDRKIYRKFRKFLLDEGFIMHQYSVYSKIVLNNSVKNLLVKRITEQTPEKGMVTLLSVTEKQFSKMIYLTGEEDRNLAATDKRLIILGDDDG